MLIKDYIKKHGNTHFQSVLTKKGKQKLSYPNWIITDMRFPNEMEAVKQREGITIRVNRPTYKNPKEVTVEYIETINHPSETALDNAEFDYEIINDGTIADLVKKVREILIDERII